MENINYVDLNRCNNSDRANYRVNAERNLRFFNQIIAGLKDIPPGARDLFDKPRGENAFLMKRISEVGKVELEDVERFNNADEILNLSACFTDNFGCTSVARNGVIGQTLDLYDVGLSIVREKNSLYVTIPPYLAVFGMNENLAFCTNYLQGPVKQGVPVSQIRRDLLRQDAMEGCFDYLKNISRSTTVNFLLSDGKKVVDLEVAPDKTLVHEQHLSGGNYFNAHTNHFVEGDIIRDDCCPRLKRAAELLGRGERIEKILDDSQISLPVAPNHLGVRFGSIIKAIMDVRNRLFFYKGPEDSEYKVLAVN